MKFLKTIMNKILKKITFAILLYKLKKNLCEDTNWTFKYSYVDGDLMISYYNQIGKFVYASFISKPVNPFKYYDSLFDKAWGLK